MKLNLPLTLGLLVIVLLVAVMLFPNSFTKINPYGMQSITFGTEGGSLSIDTPPFPPSKAHLFGTDELGRDLYSFIIHGTKLTLSLTLLVVAGRFLLALPMGLAAGFGSQAATALTNLFSALFTTIPALIISIIVLKMNFFLSLDKTHSILAFVMVLTIVGWGKLAVVIRERVEDIVSSPFFRGEIAIGKGPLRLAMENVLPHLASELVVLFFMEIAAALTILMQLGVFAVFIGNLRLIDSTDGGKLAQLKVSFEPEWASMLATSRNFLRTAPWMVLAPASAFFITILGFNLFGEGLKRLLLKRDAKFPVYVRTALSLNWQRLAKDATEKPGFKALTAVLLLFVFIFPVLNFARAAKPSFNLSESASALSSNQEQVIIGTEEAKHTAEDIAKAFGELGLSPLSQSFINEYPIDDFFIPKVADLIAAGRNGETKTFVYDRDYTVTSFGEFALEGKIYNAREEDLYSGKNYPYFTDKFVLFDSSYYSQKAVESLVEKIMTESKAQGVLVMGRKGLPLPVSLGKKAYKGPVVWISPDAADYLTSVPENTLKVSLKSRQLESKGRNVIGVLPGSDKNLKKETVIIGLSYNYRAGEQGGREKVLLGLELVKKLASQKEIRTRNIVVAFWDGTVSEGTNGLTHYTGNSQQDAVLYLDLTQVTGNGADNVVVFTQWAPVKNLFAWSLGHQLAANFNQSGIPVVDAVKDLSFTSSVMYYQKSIPTVMVAVPPSGGGNGKYPLSKLGEVLAESIKRNNY